MEDIYYKKTMDKKASHLSAALGCFLLFFFCCSPVFGWQAKVVGVTDGDTLKVLSQDGVQVKIRLYGVDTPESKQAYGKKATAFTAGMVAGKVVSVETIDVDRYGRQVAIVTSDGYNVVNEALIENGFAWVYRQYCKREECRSWLRSESEARSARLGLWADQAPVAPWEWRKDARKR